MPATFSINVGTTFESARIGDIYSVLQNLPDNTSKLITPKDVRDAVFSVWANSVFKQTIGTASIEYIGIDSNNPANRDVKEKIFIGKRNVAGTDIMSNSLLSNSNDSDIFFFNTKPDTSSQSITKISILAGTNSSLYNYAPYIKSEFIGSTFGDSISMSLYNPSLYGGPINIYSYTGRVAVNGIIFPTVAESFASASNGQILRYNGTYPNGSLIWSNDTVSIANIGATGSPTTIYGSPVMVNGYPLEFTDINQIPLQVGGITQGSTFSSVPIVDMLNRILYPYVPPSTSLSIINNVTGTTYSEVGTTASVTLSYNITRYSVNISTSQISGTTFSGVSFSASPGTSLFGTVSAFTYSLPLHTFNYVLSVSDDPIFNFFSQSATASIGFIYPTMYGFNSTLPVFHHGTLFPFHPSFYDANYICSSLNRTVLPSPGSQSVFLPYNGIGYLYFIIPSSYSIPRYIKDPNGYVIHDYGNWTSSAFTYSSISSVIVPSGGGLSYSLSSNVWVTLATCSYPGGNFEFIF